MNKHDRTKDDLENIDSAIVKGWVTWDNDLDERLDIQYRLFMVDIKRRRVNFVKRRNSTNRERTVGSW